MDVVRFAIRNPVKVTVGVILVLLCGAISLITVPVQLTPDVDRPTVTVRTDWPGRSPQEIEQSILLEQEDKLKSIQGLWKMTSRAQLGRADITLQFNIGADISRALLEVSSRLDEVPEYPDDVDRSSVRAADTVGDDSLAYLRLLAEDPDFEVAGFHDYAERFVKPAFERIPGVAEINVMGGRERQVHIQFDPVALAQRGISVGQLRSALELDNVNESAGDLANGRQDVRFRVLGQFESLDPLRRTVVKQDGSGVPIRLEDVAEVKLVLEKQVAYARWNGRTSMNLFVKRETGANVLEIMEHVRQRVEELNAPGGLLRSYKNDRHGLRLHVTFDDSVYIYRALELVRKNLMLGGCLAVLVLLFFLRSLRPTLIIAMAIPISVIGTFVVMVLTGRNLNVVSLAGLCFAVGMVVDNAIVVLENIDRHLATGQSPPHAAYRATREVWGAVLASTLTTIAVFGPVLTVKEEVGQLFYDIALAICAAVGLSLIVSITVIPTAGATLLRQRRTEDGAVSRATRSLFGLAPLARWLCELLSRWVYLVTFRSLAGIWIRIVIVSMILFVALAVSWKMILPANYLPNGNKNLVLGLMYTPPGYSLEQKELVGRRLEASIRPYWEAKNSQEAKAIGPLIDVQTGETIDEVPAIDEFFFAIVEGRGYMIA
ncbi:MAG: efflux RND transporter permease subunit, partial [Planctomycetes bacterium]|nr:efflux RND transporter permease subunit [Planctomycetota bacterium]